MQFRLPDKQTVLEVHDIVISTFGGLVGVPHPEYIESTLARPESYYSFSSYVDLHLIAAVLLHGFVKNHAFSEGNKRTALLTCLLTYNNNNVSIAYSLAFNKRFERLVLDIAENRITDIRKIRRRLRSLILDFTEIDGTIIT